MFCFHFKVLINYGAEWQAAWDEHVRNWRQDNSDTGKNMEESYYIRAEVLNDDLYSPIRTMDERITDPYDTSIKTKCFVNVTRDLAYLFAPLTTPYFKREWDRSSDMRDGSKGDNLPCSIIERHGIKNVEDIADSISNHRFFYTIELEVEKHHEGTFFSEFHEVTNVPREAIVFVNLPYTDDIFLEKSFRHEMKLPDDIFPKAWMNLIVEQ